MSTRSDPKYEGIDVEEAGAMTPCGQLTVMNSVPAPNATSAMKPRNFSNMPKDGGYLQLCKEKFKHEIPMIEEMHQPIHWRELVLATRHGKQNGAAQEFIHLDTAAYTGRV